MANVEVAKVAFRPPAPAGGRIRLTRRPSRSAAFFYAKRIFANHLPPYLACRSDSDAASRPSAGGGFVKPTRSKRSAQTRRNKRACARRPGKRACEAPAKNQAPSDWGGDSPPPPRMARWIDPMANSVGAPGSALCFERRERRKKWRRNMGKAAKRLCRFRRGAERAKGRDRGGRGESRKKGGKKTEREEKIRRAGWREKEKKTENQGRRDRRFAAPGEKKEAMRLLFFLHFASAPRGA